MFLEELVSSFDDELVLYDKLITINALRTYGTCEVDDVDIDGEYLEASLQQDNNKRVLM